jgi:hypothetical protein
VQVGAIVAVAVTAVVPLYTPNPNACVVNVHEEDIEAVTLKVAEEVVACAEVVFTAE